jgi:hypothetical protein
MQVLIQPQHPSIHTIARVALRGMVGAIVLLLWVVAVGRAGQYHVYSCSDPITQAPLPTSGWAETPGLVVQAENNCGTGGSLFTSVSADFAQTTSSWTFSAPAGTEIAAATVYREVSVNYKAKGFWAAPENIDNEANAFDLCEVPGNVNANPEARCERGNVFVYRDCKTTALCPPVPYAPADTLVVPSSHLPSHQLAFDVVCLAQGCQGSADIRSADIVLEQSTAPTATAVSGSLTTESTLHGVTDIEVTATDPASGVFQAILQADGKTVAKQIIDTAGGSCEPYKEEPNGTYVFLHVLPCPQAVSNVDIPFNTAQIPDGPQQISVLVSDAAGNTTTILNRNVTVENSGQYLIRVQREQQEQALAARGTCNAECDDHASLRAADAKLTARAFTRRYVHSGLTLKGQLLDHTGSPMKGAVIELHEQASYPSSRSVLLATATTAANGEWTFHASKGPSRVLTIGYRAYSKDPDYATQLQYHENVQAGISIAAPRRVHPGRAFDFRGQLAGGYISAGGVLVSLEIYYGGEWREIALLRTNRRGEFVYRYTFAAVQPTIYRFRASVPSAVFYPFASAASPSTHVRVLTG